MRNQYPQDEPRMNSTIRGCLDPLRALARASFDYGKTCRDWFSASAFHFGVASFRAMTPCLGPANCPSNGYPGVPGPQYLGTCRAALHGTAALPWARRLDKKIS